MTIEQKRLLYQIADWHSKEFYARMEDHWTDALCEFMRNCVHMIDELEQEYVNKYGALPEWPYIDDVLKAKKQLKIELEALEEKII